jgi:RNA polymerase sigma-70 factor, ECF subfamily
MKGPAAGDRFAEAWRANRPYLVDMAFRMLGDVGDAEDVVQDAFSRLACAEPGEIEDERGWLTVVTGRLCIDQIRSARSRREHTGDAAALESAIPLAPAPPMDPADRVTLDDEVRAALFVIMQRLSPAERVAFVLHDVFRTPFDTIAETLGRPVATCRQLARRARQKIAGAPPNLKEVALPEHRLVTERFITACTNGDLDALLAVLHPDVWGVAELPALGTQTSHGPGLVAGNLIRYYGPGTTLVSHPVSGQPALLAYRDQELCAVITLSVEHHLITKVDITSDVVIVGE